MYERTDDLRVETTRPMLPPAILLEEIPATAAARKTVTTARAAVAGLLDGSDPRLLAVVGPCSVHDPEAAVDYARGLKVLADEIADDVLVVMRTYFEKPRTVTGWKGLINDPDLDGRFRINQGLRVARQLLLDLAELGVPPGTEFLDPITPQFVADLVAWGAIGARTTESQIHREMASGLSMPIGFKNGTGGNVKIAVDGVRAARSPHHFLGVTKQGLAAIVATRGNPDCHVILRGGREGPNHGPEHVRGAAAMLAKHDLPPRVLVDCSHGNSGKDHTRQPQVAAEVAEQVREGSTAVLGVMLESFLEAGRQDLGDGTNLRRGRSITDACMDLSTTGEVLRDLAAASAQRRRQRSGA